MSDNDTSYGKLLVHFTPDILVIRPNKAKELIRIAPNGRLFWHEREVETDDDFRAAMLDLAKFFQGRTE